MKANVSDKDMETRVARHKRLSGASNGHKVLGTLSPELRGSAQTTDYLLLSFLLFHKCNWEQTEPLSSTISLQPAVMSWGLSNLTSHGHSWRFNEGKVCSSA